MIIIVLNPRRMNACRRLVTTHTFVRDLSAGHSLKVNALARVLLLYQIRSVIYLGSLVLFMLGLFRNSIK
jgi:hypothetical protein